jgi:NTE family protein
MTRIGLALSGGGFRAALFHIGSLWRLNELGWLGRLTRITSVSGGSITSALLGLRWRELRFDDGVATNLAELVLTPLRAFCARDIDVWAIGRGALNPFKTAADYLAEAYDEHLFRGASLQDLPKDGEGPRFVIYATSLQTGRSVRLSQPYLADYLVGVLDRPEVPLAAAVAASSAFPPLLAPVVLRTDPERWRRVDGALLFDQADYRRKLCLADGGVYDNLGLEALIGNVETVLVSDAGAPLVPEPELSLVETTNTGIAYRSLAIITEQQRALRKRKLIDDYKAGALAGTYWGIATQIDNYLDPARLPAAMVRDGPVSGSLKALRTRLDSFSPEEQGRLINWGYALADAAMRRHVLEPGAAAGTWPVPEHALA